MSKLVTFFLPKSPQNVYVIHHNTSASIFHFFYFVCWYFFLKIKYIFSNHIRGLSGKFADKVDCDRTIRIIPIGIEGLKMEILISWALAAPRSTIQPASCTYWFRFIPLSELETVWTEIFGRKWSTIWHKWHYTKIWQITVWTCVL